VWERGEFIADYPFTVKLMYWPLKRQWQILKYKLIYTFVILSHTLNSPLFVSNTVYLSVLSLLFSPSFLLFLYIKTIQNMPWGALPTSIFVLLCGLETSTLVLDGLLLNSVCMETAWEGQATTTALLM
jgi:hypothetical protein